MSAFTIPTIFKAIDKFSGPVKAMKSNLSSFAQKAEVGISRLDRSVRKFTPSLGGMAKQALSFASAGILIAGIGGAVATVRDFEQANADLSAVMNTTSENSQKLFNDAARLGGQTSKTATEVVGLQEAFARLGFETPAIINMTESTISGAVAMNAELSETAELVGAMVKTFDGFSSLDTPKIIDQMTLATQKSALNFEKLQTSLPIVAGAANAAGIPFTKMTALLGKLSDSGIDASSSATALRNIFLESAKRGDSYSEILQSIQKNQDKLTAANDAFGKRGAVSASILANNLKEVDILAKKLENDFKGVAAAAEAKRLNTFGGSLDLLASKWSGILLAADDSASGLKKVTKVIQFLTKNLETVVNVGALLVAGFVALKIAVLAGNVAIFSYNVITGIAAVNSATMAVSIGASNVAMRAQQIATYGVIAAQWLWNAALASGAIAMQVLISPITGFIALGVILIATIVGMFNHWEKIKKAFTSGDILGGIKLIGLALVDSLLHPVQLLLELLAKVPGMANLAGGGAVKIQQIRENLFKTDAEKAESSPKGLLNPRLEEQRNSVERRESVEKQDFNLNINDLTGRASFEQELPPFINLSSTVGL